MREILFRAIINNPARPRLAKFNYGYVSKQPNGTWCMDMECGDYIEINPETIGEFIGLKDKNGKKIFTDDMVQGRNRITESVVKEKVTFLNGCFMIGNWNAHEFFNKHQEIEVIGNTHGNVGVALSLGSKIK